MAIRSRARRRDDLRFEDAFAQAGPISFCWRDSRRTVLQDGVAWEVEATGPRRSRDIRRALPDVDHDGPGGPLWSGGLAFDARHEADGIWQAFPAARFRLPLRQWCWDETGCIETTVHVDEPPLGNGVRKGGPAEEATDPGRWHQAVTAAVAAIQDGDVSKVVLARMDVRPPIDAADAFRRLMDQEDGTAYWFQEHDHVFFGCTPETLVRIRDGHLSTHALAGSAPRGADDDAQAAALRSSGKDILEHELVAAFLRERLVEAGVKGVRQDNRRLRRLRHIQHLETPIHGEAPGMHVLDVGHHLHPTPAVCGTPRGRSMELIQSLEPFGRGWYAGAVGCFDARGEGELCVALRGALSTPAACYLYAGAGIVAGSEPEAEWRETETKLQALREVA